MENNFLSEDKTSVLIPKKSAIVQSFSEQTIQSGKHYFEINVPNDDVQENMILGLASFSQNSDKVEI